MTPTTPNPFPLYEHPQHEDWLDGKYIVYYGGAHDDEREIGSEVRDWTFVLKPDTDPHARVALAAYAESIRPHRPNIAIELDQVLSDFR